MKALLPIGLWATVLCLTATTMFAQERNMEEALDHFFGKLDLQEIGSNLLYDKSISRYNWSFYDGNELDDAYAFSRTDWNWNWLSLKSAEVNPDSRFPDLSYFKDLQENLNPKDPIPISLLFVDYHKMKDGALARRELIHNREENFLMDNPQRNASPYQAHRFLCATAIESEFEQAQLQFTLPEALFFRNTGEVRRIEIDFGDGLGFRNVEKNKRISVLYKTVGEKIISLRLKDETGCSHLTKFKIEIKSLNQQEKMYSLFRDDFFTTTNGSVADIFYGKNCNEMLRPIIFVEGFNPDQFDAATGSELLRELIGLAENYILIDTPTGQTLYEDLFDNGYDIIYVDFANGAGDLIENAVAVREVIQEVNARLDASGSEEEILLVGASMGGVIAYLTLVDMEEDGEDSNVEYLVTYDSPLRGANVPVGLQYLVRRFGEVELPFVGPLQNMIPELEEAADLLQEPCVRQMLFLWAYDTSPGYWSDQFYTHLHRNGPPAVPHIAIANGAGNGAGNLLGPRQQFLKLEGVMPLPPENIPADPPIPPIPAGSIGNFVIEYLEVYARDVSNPDFNSVYKHKLRILIDGVSVWSDTVDEISAGPTFDSAPGGMENLGIPYDQLVQPGIAMTTEPPNEGAFCFVPTFSALNIEPSFGYPELYAPIGADCGGTGVERCMASYDNSVISPFSNVPEFNQRHVSINTSLNTLFLTFTANANLTGSSISNRSFNFGEAAEIPENTWDNFAFAETDNRIDEDFTIGTNGRLLVNNNDRIGFTDEANNPETATGSLFQVNVGPVCNTSVTVTIADQGELLVGHQGGTHLGKLIIEDQATVHVKNGGQLKANDNSEIIVEAGGRIQVDGGATIQSRKAKIIVKSGGELDIKNLGRLLSSWGGDIIIEQGGTLILDGSIVELHGVNGLLEIKGKLHIKSSFEFVDRGLIRFYPSNEILIDDEWTFRGSSKFDTNIELRPSTVVDLGNADVELWTTTVAYGKNASIYQNGGQFVSYISRYNGESEGGEIALALDNMTRIRLLLCDFDGVTTGMSIFNYSGAFPASISHSNFSNSSNPIVTQAVNRINVSYSNFEQCVIPLFAIDTDYFGFHYSNIKGDGGTIGAYLADVGGFYMNGGSIADCALGIYSPWDKKANVYLYRQATLENNGVGVLIEKGGNVGMETHGLVLADCARFINNTIGIQGEDLELKVDAYENCNDCLAEEVAPNHFIGGTIFDICYVDTDNTQLDAKGNYWGASGANNAWYSVRDIDGSGGCSAAGSNIPVNVLPETLDEMQGCNGPQVIGPPHLPPVSTSACPIKTGETESKTVYQDFHQGYTYFRNENFADALPYFQRTADVNNLQRDPADFICRHYIDVSRAILKGYENVGFTAPEEVEEPLVKLQLDEINSMSKTAMRSDIKVFPNPVDQHLIVQSREGTAQTKVVIFDTFGKRVWSQHLVDKITIDVASWPTGIYFLQVNNAKGEKIQTEKIVVQ